MVAGQRWSLTGSLATAWAAGGGLKNTIGVYKKQEDPG